MAFQTGTINHAIELADKFRLFLMENNWVEDLSSPIENGKLIHLHRENRFLHLKALHYPLNNNVFRHQNHSLAINMSDHFDPSIDFSAINPDISRIPMIDTLHQGQLKYWFFHLEDPVVVFCVVEYEADRLVFLMLGDVVKYSDWVGGLFYGASWSSGLVHKQVLNAGPFQDNSQASYGTTYVHAEVDGFKWLTCAKNPQRNFRLVRGMSFWHKSLIDHSPSAFNGLSTLIPIHLFAERDEGFFSPIGEVGHVRYLNIKPYIPGQIIQLGSDQWMVFPFHHKGFMSSPRYDGTGNLGYAVRLIT